jgi:hypothetical protein
MKRIRILGLCLTVACAMAAMAGSAASAAQPEFYGKAIIGGVVPPVDFTATVGPSFIEDRGSKAKLSCSGGSAAGGEVTGPETLKHLVITVTTCESSELYCNSTGQVSGTIVTNSLEGSLGNVTATTPGIRLFKEGEKEKEPKTGTIEEFYCGGGIEKVVVTGSIIGSLSEAAGNTPEQGKFPGAPKLTYAEGGGLQKYTTFLAGQCGGAGECGPEQLTATINGNPEQRGKSVIMTLKAPVSNLGYTQ